MTAAKALHKIKSAEAGDGQSEEANDAVSKALAYW